MFSVKLQPGDSKAILQLKTKLEMFKAGFYKVGFIGFPSPPILANHLLISFPSSITEYLNMLLKQN